MMYSHTYVLRAKTHKNLIIWKIFCLSSSRSQRCGNKFFDCWQNLYTNFSVWNLYFFKRNKKLHNLFYYNLTMIKSGESWDGDKSTIRFLLCFSGFIKPPWGKEKRTLLLCTSSSEKNSHVHACITNNNKVPYLLNPLSIKM